MPATDTTKLRAAIRELRAEQRVRRLPRAIARIRAAVRHPRVDDAAPSRVELITAIERIRLAVRQQRSRLRIPAVGERLRTHFAREARREEAAWKRLSAGLSGDGLPVPVLSACGHGTAEARFTQLLRYFLDPRAPHGLGTGPLRVLFGHEVAHPDATVEAEVNLEGGVGDESDESERGSYLDLLVLHSDKAVLIEQKLGSAESAEETTTGRLSQLARYSRAFKAGFPNYEADCRKFFLTPTGRTSKDDASWQSVSHADWVTRLAGLLDDSALSTLARFNLLSLLWELLVGPLAMNDGLAQLGRLAEEVLRDPARHPSVRRGALAVFPHLDLLLRIVKALP